MLKFFNRKDATHVRFEVRIKTNRKHVNSKDICFRMYKCRKAGYMVVKKNEVFADNEDNINNKGKRRRDFIDHKTESRAKFYVIHNKKKDNWFSIYP